ncbi:MAG: DUF167 domain-containing protein [Fimbriimonadaceae bacterium]|nr:DUF167 domain-containing protein [Fimbriimonadaceae bacterium]
MSCTFSVRVTTRARRPGVSLGEDGVVRVAVSAPPVDGAANEAVRDAIAKVVGVGKRSVRIVSGEKSRDKQVAVESLEWDQVHERLF